jgi:hypothetical protein
MKPKANHYVPQFYLNGFVEQDPERKAQPMLWVYEVNKAPRRSRPRNVAFENYFYRYAKAGEKETIDIEQRLSELESIAAPVLRRLGDGRFSLTPQERGEFAGFISLIFARGPAFRDTSNTLAANMFLLQTKAIAHTPGALEQSIRDYEEETGESIDMPVKELRDFLLSDDYNLEQTSKGFWLGTVFRTMVALIPTIERMHWVLCVSKGNESFITSDNPVALYDPTPQMGGVGFASSPNAELTFPINRRVCLVCRWKGKEGIAHLSPFRVRQLNKRTIWQAYEYVYASERSSKIKNLVDKLHSGRPKEYFKVNVRG